MERGKSKGFANAIDDLVAMFNMAAGAGGNKKVIEVTSERSESWQQDIAQVIIPGMS